MKIIRRSIEFQKMRSDGHRSLHLFLLSFFVCIVQSSCVKNQHESYNPCLSPYRLEEFWPAAVGFDWVPYIPGIPFIFKHSPNDSLIFKISNYRDPKDFLQSRFFIACPQDTGQQKPVEYNLKSYNSILKNMDSTHQLASIQINLGTLLDEQNSTYDKVLLADILSLNSGLKNHGDVPLFQFPVLNRGFNPQNSIRFIYKDSLYLDKRLIRSVYYNDENPFQIQIFYTASGIEAIRFQNKSFFRSF